MRDLPKALTKRQGGEADRFRESLVKWYGSEKGAEVKFAEAFEICDYGKQPTAEEIKQSPA